MKGATYILGQRFTARYTCAGSAVAACTGSVPDGSYVKTGRVGKFTFTVAATNKAGKTTTTTVSYTVSYKFCQVTPPAPASSVVTFKVYLCNASGKDVTTRSAAISAVSVDGKTGPVPGRPGSATRFAFVSSPTQPFATFELNTKRLSPGPHTLRVTVPNDPATHSLAFIVRRPARARPGPGSSRKKNQALPRMKEAADAFDPGRCRASLASAGDRGTGGLLLTARLAFARALGGRQSRREVANCLQIRGRAGPVERPASRGGYLAMRAPRHS